MLNFRCTDFTGDGTTFTQQAIQLLDNTRFSFFRMDADQRATTKRVIDLTSEVRLVPTCSSRTDARNIRDVGRYSISALTFGTINYTSSQGGQIIIMLDVQHYPESMKAQYMASIPFVMRWVMSFVKLSRGTMSKITVMSYESGLVDYIGHKDELPRLYVGTGEASLHDISYNTAGNASALSVI